MGNADFYRPASDDVSDEDFNAATIGSRAIDSRIAELRQLLAERRHAVTQCTVKACGFAYLDPTDLTKVRYERAYYARRSRVNLGVR
jgi:hypothetical protein